MSSAKMNFTRCLGDLEVVSENHSERLHMFGLKWLSRSDLDYLTLDEALDQEMLDLAEVGEEGTVPSIKVVNKSKRMVFLIAGELLIGCKQDRVLNTSVMVPAESTIQIPVTCVEAGRWGYRSRKFTRSRSYSPSSLKSMLLSQVSAGYEMAGSPESDQGAVWQEVSRKMRVMGSHSPSMALNDIVEDYAVKLDEGAEELPAPDACSGVVFAIGGKVVGAELFDSPAMLAKNWDRLVRSYAIDVFEEAGKESPRATTKSVAEWLESAGSADVEPFESPGVGQDVRIRSRKLSGAMLVVKDQPVHLTLFPQE